MAYQSGRTVKSPATKPTTVASATRDARRLTDRYLSGVAGVTVRSSVSADPEALAPRIRTVITWPGPLDRRHVQLAMAITELPGYLKASNDTVSITYLRGV